MLCQFDRDITMHEVRYCCKELDSCSSSDNSSIITYCDMIRALLTFAYNNDLELYKSCYSYVMLFDFGKYVCLNHEKID